MSGDELTGNGHILLVPCGKSKGTRLAVAKDMYISPLFREERAYAERAGHSAVHSVGRARLVAPDNGWLSWPLSTHRLRAGAVSEAVALSRSPLK
jgi:hypothetical protein